MRQVNNFDALRILAAVAVLFSHSFPLSYGSDAWEPLWRLSHGQTTLGGLAVCVFFVISGFLITQSFERSRSPRAFLTARALRLLPGLTIVLLALAFVIGPAISSLPVREYFSSTQPYRFVAVNLSFVRSDYELPGVFAHNPYRGVVNGSLWTLPFEAQCYIIVLCLGVCGVLNRFTTLGLLIAGCAASASGLVGVRAEFYSYFMAGAAFYHWRLPLRGWAAILCGLIWAVCLFTGGFRIASASIGAYAIIYLALAPRIRLPDLARFGDLSYGTYVWAFPVQQLVTAALGVWSSWYLNFALSLPIVLGLAWVSWHFIEAPALLLKKRRPAAMSVAAE